MNKTRAYNWLVKPTLLAGSDVGGNFFIRKFTWEAKCKANFFFKSERSSEVISMSAHILAQV